MGRGVWAEGSPGSLRKPGQSGSSAGAVPTPTWQGTGPLQLEGRPRSLSHGPGAGGSRDTGLALEHAEVEHVRRELMLARTTPRSHYSGERQYIVTAPGMSTGIILMGAFEFLPHEVKTTPISMKIGDFLIGKITFQPWQLPDTRTEVPGMPRADFVSPGKAPIL